MCFRFRQDEALRLQLVLFVFELLTGYMLDRLGLRLELNGTGFCLASGRVVLQAWTWFGVYATGLRLLEVKLMQVWF